MIDVVAKLVLVEGFKELIRGCVKNVSSLKTNKTDKAALTDAVLAMQQAIESTRNFISENGYQRNTDLQEIWRNVFRKCVASNAADHIPEWLYHKIDFWGHPQDWIGNPETLQLVPRLFELDEECRMLLRRLK